MSESLFEWISLRWDDMLNITRGELEFMSDTDIYLFLEKGMTDGCSYISKRCSQASSRYLKSYNTKQESKHIIYLGDNNFYCYKMSKFLLAGGSIPKFLI